MEHIKRRLAYIIWERCDWDNETNWLMAERMIDNVLSGKDAIESLEDYLSYEDCLEWQKC